MTNAVVPILTAVLGALFAYFLGKRQAEHQVRVTRTYEERAEVVAHIYKLVVEAEMDLKAWSFPFGSAAQEQREVAATRFNELSHYFHTKSIWLDQKVCDTLESFLNEVLHLFSDMDAMTDPNLDNLPEDALARSELREAIVSRAHDEIPAIRKQLREEFKELLKVVDPSPSGARPWWKVWQRQRTTLPETKVAEKEGTTTP
jgi:hypothetical protein